MFKHRIAVAALSTIFALPLAAQVSAHGSAHASAGVPHGMAVPTQLLGGVNSGNAKVGQQVLAKLAQPAKLADGSTLPAGSQLMGHLTQVKSFAGDSKATSSLKMLFDQAKTPDGQVKKIKSIVQGVGSGSASSDAQGTPASQGNSGGGGLLGGVTGAVGGVVKTTGSVLGAVTGLPGVLLDSTGTLMSKGSDVNVPAGTQITVSVAAQE